MAKNPTDRAIVVGVDHYRGDIPALGGAINDARAFADWLAAADGGGLDPSHIRLILSTDAQDPRPTKDQVEAAMLDLIEQFAESGASIGRRLYLYFAGHGVEPRGPYEDCAVLMANASRFALGRSVPGRRAANSFRFGRVFDEVVLFMDCCRALDTLSPESALAWNDLVQPGVATRWCYAFAVPRSQGTREEPAPVAGNGTVMRGVFTTALLSALRAAADPTGQVTASTVKNFVRERLARRPGTPPPDIQFDGDIVFGAADKAASTPVTLTLRDPAKGFRVLSGVGFAPVAVAGVPDAAGRVTFRLPFGMYLVGVPAGAGPMDHSEVVTALGPEEVSFAL